MNKEGSEIQKMLLNIEETCKYLNIGKTKCREFLKEHEHEFVIRIGNRIYANKMLLDKWLMTESKR